MFSFFKKKPPPVVPPAPIAPTAATAAHPAASTSAVPAAPPVFAATGGSLIGSALVKPLDIAKVLEASAASAASAASPERERWLAKLTSGLRKTGSSISAVFNGTQINDALYEDLESALLMADTGVKATNYLLDEVKRRVASSGVTHPIAVRNILTQALAQLLQPLEQTLVIGQQQPTVIMVAGVNGAGKTTSIGKLTKHLANDGASVLLAAADTFRAAAREQLAVWADRNTVEIISKEGGDPAAVAFDAVTAGKARGKDVVLVDTAGRLPTQLHLMEELKKIKRIISKADGSDTAGPPQGGTAPLPEERGSVPPMARTATSAGAISAPHEILLVIDGNTGQNALGQVKAFDEALHLTGLIVTKLDGTAKGGVLAAIALWARERQEASPALRPVPVYFIGVGEQLEDLETFNAREFAQALLA